MSDDSLGPVLKLVGGLALALLLLLLLGPAAVPWGLLLLLLAGLVGLGAVWALVGRAWYLDRYGPVQETRALVARKYTRERGPSGVGAGNRAYWIVFDVETTTLELRAPEHVYVQLGEAQPVRLRYRGDTLLDCIPLTSRPPRLHPPELPPPPPPAPPPPPDLRPLG